jgi:flagellar assembly factor FliW
VVTSIKEEYIPIEFSLSQNYPNPFNPTTKIEYSIPKAGLVRLKVYNLLGREVAAIVNQSQAAGKYSVNFNAGLLSSGLYFYKIQVGNYFLIKKMLLMK